MLKELKESKIIEYNNEIKKGFYVRNRRLHEIDFYAIEDVEVLKYIFENGEEKSAFDIKSQMADIFKYTVGNGGSYEFYESATLYSEFFLTKEEFKEMVKDAIEKINKRDVYSIVFYLEKEYPDIFKKMGFGTGACTCEWECHECSNPLR